MRLESGDTVYHERHGYLIVTDYRTEYPEGDIVGVRKPWEAGEYRVPETELRKLFP